MVLVASQRHAGRFPAPCWSRCSALLIASRYRNCYASASASSLHSLIVVLLLHLTCLLMESSTDSLFTSTMLILQRVSLHRSIRMTTSSIRRSLSACRARLNDATGSTGAQRSAGPCSHQFSLLHTSRFRVLLPASVRTPRIVYSFLVRSFRTIITRHALSRTATSLSSRFPFSGPCFWSDSLPVHASCVLSPETFPHSSIGSVHALFPSARLVDSVCGVFGARSRSGLPSITNFSRSLPSYITLLVTIPQRSFASLHAAPPFRFTPPRFSTLLSGGLSRVLPSTLARHSRAALALTFGVSCVLRMFLLTHAALFCLVFLVLSHNFIHSQVLLHIRFQVMHLLPNIIHMLRAFGFASALRRAMRCRAFASPFAQHFSTSNCDLHVFTL